MYSFLGDYFAYFAVVSVNFISFTAGAAFSWSSPILPKLSGLKGTDENPLPEPITKFESSWITSLVNLGAVAGPILSGILSEKIGRKRTLLFFSMTMILSHVMCIFANRVYVFYVARFLLGLGVGCVFSVLPNYVGEIAEDKNRGLMGCLMGISVTLGTVFNYLVGPFVSVAVLSCASLVCPILFVVFFGFFVPESPYYFAGIDDRGKAEESLMKLRNKSSGEVEKELLMIMKTVESANDEKAHLKDLVKFRSLKKGLLITSCLVTFQQFTCIAAVLGFMEDIFEAAGTNIPGEYSAMFIGSVQFFVNLATTSLIERLGRKILLMLSAAGSSLSLVTLGLYFYLQENGHNVDKIFWIPLASLFIFIIAYNLGLGPLPWVVMGELFPSNVKSLASTITTCLCLTLAFTVSSIFQFLNEILGLGGSFWLFSSLSLIGFLFTIFVLPETKGKSLLEIQELLEGHKTSAKHDNI